MAGPGQIASLIFDLNLQTTTAYSSGGRKQTEMQPTRRKAALCLPNISSAAALAFAALLIVVSLSVYGLSQTYQVIHEFSYGTGGDWPWSELTIGPGGHMYGTTLFGGDSHSFYCYYGCGIVYDIHQRDSSWIFTPLHEFLIQEGSNPHSGVIIGPDGAFYGTTLMGGMQGSDCDVGGCGTVYKIQPSASRPTTPILNWGLNVVYYFTGGDNDGGDPSSSLVQDQAGNMYGADSGGPDNCGLVFQLNRNNGYWTFNEIYNGFYCPDGNAGIDPGGLLVDSQGNLYGVTGNGGHLSCPYSQYGCGTVFKLTHTDGGWVGSTLYEFNGPTDGAYPGGLVMDRAGNLYAGTEMGGPYGGGTVWELSPSGGGWTFRVLHSFSSSENIAGVVGRLAMDSGGSLYGVTMSEGLYGFGNIFKLAPSDGGWTYTSLYDFCAGGYPCSDGGAPLRGPTLDSNNNLFGTASEGGIGAGVIWEITP